MGGLFPFVLAPSGGRIGPSPTSPAAMLAGGESSFPCPPFGVLSWSHANMDVSGEGTTSFQERQKSVGMRRAQGPLPAQTLGSPQASHQHIPSLRVRSRSPGHTGSGRSHPYCHRSRGSHTQCRWHIHLRLGITETRVEGMYALAVCWESLFVWSINTKICQQTTPWTQRRKAITITFLLISL